ncbi:hypothetical protein BTE48_17785, partial [Oceanospirillum multiglobuliferum]
VGEIEAFSEPRIRDLERMLARQRVREFLRREIDPGAQFVVELLDLPDVLGESPGKGKRHAQHERLRREHGVVDVGIQDADKNQQVVNADGNENHHANRQDLLLDFAAAPRKPQQQTAASDETRHRYE